MYRWHALVLLLAFWLKLIPTSAFLVHQEAKTHWIPCVHGPRNCYPNLEFCLDSTHCAPQPWLILTLVFVTSLVTLVISVMWYYILNPVKRSIRWRMTAIANGVLSLGLFVGLIISFIEQPSQEIEQIEL